MNDDYALREYFYHLPPLARSNFRKTVAKACGKTSAAVSHWLTGRNKIPFLAKKEIEKIANKKIFEI